MLKAETSNTLSPIPELLCRLFNLKQPALKHCLSLTSPGRRLANWYPLAARPGILTAAGARPQRAGGFSYSIKETNGHRRYNGHNWQLLAEALLQKTGDFTNRPCLSVTCDWQHTQQPPKGATAGSRFSVTRWQAQTPVNLKQPGTGR